MAKIQAKINRFQSQENDRALRGHAGIPDTGNRHVALFGRDHGVVLLRLHRHFVGVGLGLYAALPKKKKPFGRKLSLFLVGSFLVGFAAIYGGENMQIEGLFFGLLGGVFQAAVVHYLIAKVFGPMLFGRIWCGWACWTVMILDLLPFTTPQRAPPATLWLVPLSALCRQPGAGCAGLVRIWLHRRRNGTIGTGLVHRWQPVLLRNRDRAGLCLERQPRFLQIRLPGQCALEDHIPLRAAEDRRRG